MKNLPKRIFLQIGEDIDLVEDFKDLSEVSWCSNNIHDNDIEYVLKSKVDAGQQAKEEEMIKFAEWLAASNFKSQAPTYNSKWSQYNWHTSSWHDYTTAQLLEKFRSLPPSPPKE